VKKPVVAGSQSAFSQRRNPPSIPGRESYERLRHMIEGTNIPTLANALRARIRKSAATNPVQDSVSQRFGMTREGNMRYNFTCRFVFQRAADPLAYPP
jgi:hypothetical protein